MLQSRLRRACSEALLWTHPLPSVGSTPFSPMEQRVRSRLPVSPRRNAAAKDVMKAVRSRSRGAPLAQAGLPGQRSPALLSCQQPFERSRGLLAVATSLQNPPVVCLDDGAHRGAGKPWTRAFQRYFGLFQDRFQPRVIAERVAEKGLASAWWTRDLLGLMRYELALFSASRRLEAERNKTKPSSIHDEQEFSDVH